MWTRHLNRVMRKNRRVLLNPNRHGVVSVDTFRTRLDHNSGVSCCSRLLCFSASVYFDDCRSFLHRSQILPDAVRTAQFFLYINNHDGVSWSYHPADSTLTVGQFATKTWQIYTDVKVAQIKKLESSDHYHLLSKVTMKVLTNG